MHHVAGRFTRPKRLHSAHDGLLVKASDGRNSPIVAGRIVTRRARRRELGALFGARCGYGLTAKQNEGRGSRESGTQAISRALWPRSQLTTRSCDNEYIPPPSSSQVNTSRPLSVAIRKNST